MTQSSVSKSSPKSRHQYRGSLADTPLPEILFKVYRFQVPGVLTVTVGETTNDVYVRGGHVVHARTSDLEASLGSWALRSGLLSRDAFDEVMRERETVDRRLGALLVDGGYLSPEDVRRAIQGQTEAIVWSLFGWEDGEAVFEIGQWEDEHVIPIQIPVGRAIVRGIRRELEAASLVDRLGGPDVVLKPRFRVEDAIEIGLDRVEYDLLRSIDGERPLYEVCGGGTVTQDEAIKLVYAFQVLELIRRVP